MERITKTKADRKVGVQRSFKKQTIKDYKLMDQSLSSKPGERLFLNICTGTQEPEIFKGEMVAAHIVPQMFGKRIMRKLFGDHHHFRDIFGSRNALILPQGVACALDDWAITVVPDIPEDPTLEERRRWVEMEPKEFKFRVLDSEHESLQQSVSSTDMMRVGRNLDQQRLKFKEGCDFRPSVKYLYFGHCCAIMRKHYKLFENDPPEEFLSDKKVLKIMRKRELNGIKPTGLFSRTKFWLRTVRELQRMNEDADFLLDWSMDLREQDLLMETPESSGRLGMEIEEEEGQGKDNEVGYA